MRPINVTLCSHTWELAKRKNNFSAWVRKKLDDEDKERRSDREVMYWAYCNSCDISYENKLEFMVEHQYCKKCNQKCEYMGAME